MGLSNIFTNPEDWTKMYHDILDTKITGFQLTTQLTPEFYSRTQQEWHGHRVMTARMGYGIFK